MVDASFLAAGSVSAPEVMMVQFSSFKPSVLSCDDTRLVVPHSSNEPGSRSGASPAVVRRILLTVAAPSTLVMISPLRSSPKLRYLVVAT
jgi:hypothetical protein